MKNEILFLLRGLAFLSFCFAFFGCASLHRDGRTNQEIRNDFDGIQSQQRETENGIADAQTSGGRIADGIDDIESTVDGIERIVDERDSIDGDFEKELAKIRERKVNRDREPDGRESETD